MRQSSELIPPRAVEKPRKKSIRHVGALALASMAFMGASEKGEAAETAFVAADMKAVPQFIYSGENKKPLKPQRLLSLEKLPGYNIKVSPERRQQLKEAATKIVRRPKDSEGSWELWCSGTMVKQPSNPATQKGGPEQKLVITAGHCFDAETGIKEGNFPDPKIAAQDYVNASAYEYGFVDPLVPYIEGENLQPFAKAVGISVSNRREDWALLMPEALANEDGSRPGRTLEQYGAVDFQHSYNRSPKRGMEVAVLGWPTAASRPLEATGRFIGRINKYPNWAKKEGRLDVVAIDTGYDFSSVSGKGAEFTDACRYGASGSTVVGENYVSGPLAMRLNLAADPEFVVEIYDKIPRTSPDFQASVNTRRKEFKYWWKVAQSRLSVAIPKAADTLCFYEVDELVDRASGTDNFKQLYQGFGIYPPK